MQQRPPWEPQEVSPSSFPHNKVCSAKPLKDVQSVQLIHFHRPRSQLRVLWVAVVVSPTQSNRRPLKKKCQDKQNESLGDLVMGTECECGNHSFDLCSDMFSICFHTECTFSPWIANNLNQGKTITKWPFKHHVCLGTQ